MFYDFTHQRNAAGGGQWSLRGSGVDTSQWPPLGTDVVPYLAGWYELTRTTRILQDAEDSVSTISLGVTMSRGDKLSLTDLAIYSLNADPSRSLGILKLMNTRQLEMQLRTVGYSGYGESSSSQTFDPYASAMASWEVTIDGCKLRPVHYTAMEDGKHHLVLVTPGYLPHSDVLEFGSFASLAPLRLQGLLEVSDSSATSYLQPSVRGSSASILRNAFVCGFFGLTILWLQPILGLAALFARTCHLALQKLLSLKHTEDDVSTSERDVTDLPNMRGSYCKWGCGSLLLLRAIGLAFEAANLTLVGERGWNSFSLWATPRVIDGVFTEGTYWFAIGLCLMNCSGSINIGDPQLFQIRMLPTIGWTSLYLKLVEALTTNTFVLSWLADGSLTLIAFLLSNYNFMRARSTVHSMNLQNPQVLSAYNESLFQRKCRDFVFLVFFRTSVMSAITATCIPVVNFNYFDQIATSVTPYFAPQGNTVNVGSRSVEAPMMTTISTTYILIMFGYILYHSIRPVDLLPRHDRLSRFMKSWFVQRF